MDQEKRALVFASNTVADPVLIDALRCCALIPLWPWELTDQSVNIALIVIDRPAENAVKICANLRTQERFYTVPILLLLDSVADAYLSQSLDVNTDIFYKPIKGQALQRYIGSILQATALKITNSLTDKESVRVEADGKQEKIAAAIDVGGKPAYKEAKRKAAADLALPAEANQSHAPGTAVSKAKDEKPSLLRDVIPTSGQLLKIIAEPIPVTKGGILCSYCRAWLCRREDAFCSRCGHTLVALAKLAEIVGFEPLGDHLVGRLIEFKNAGHNPVRMAFKVLTTGQLEKRFSLNATSAILDGGSSEDLLITFDARGLDLTTSYRADLEITSNEKGHSTRRLELFVERLAKPKVIGDEVCSFVIGIENEWEFKVSNDGGGSLKLVKVILDEAVLDLSEEVVVRGGRTSTVRLRIPNLDLSLGTHPKKIRFEFEHYSAIVLDIIVSAVRPPRLTAQPSELDFGVVSTSRARMCSLTIFNSGGEELVVESIEPSVDWAECLVDTPLRIPPGMPKIFDVRVLGSTDLIGDRDGIITINSNSYNGHEQEIAFRAAFIEPEPYEEYIGIDFGTTASCVAVLNQDFKPVIIELDRVEAGSTADPRIMPSVLYFQEDGQVSAGRDALNQSSIQPANAVSSIKRVLGMKHTKMLAGREYNATQLASKIIEQLVVRTEDGLFQRGQYQTPRRAVVTVPVEFFDNQRRALLEACKLTGLEMESHTPKGIVIDEAHAAALYYLSKRAETEQQAGRERLMIFDFGGGTLDCVLIEVESADEKILLQTLALGGDPRLGGEDVDWALVGRLADLAKKEYPDFNLDSLGDESKFDHKFRNPLLHQAALRTRAAFKRQAEIAKIALGSAPAVELKIEPLLHRNATPLEPFILNGLSRASIQTTLSREDLEMALAPLIERAVGVVRTVCQRANESPDSVDTVLHVGRTSLIPMVRQQVNAILSNAEDRSHLIEPKLCVALGAALWGYIKDKPSANIEFVGGANRIIHDICYLDFKGMKQVFVPIFPANTEFPVEKVIEFQSGKEILELRFAESHGVGANGNANYQVIGTARIDTRGVSTPQIKFALDENRMLEIIFNGRVQQVLGGVEQ